MNATFVTVIRKYNFIMPADDSEEYQKLVKWYRDEDFNYEGADKEWHQMNKDPKHLRENLAQFLVVMADRGDFDASIGEFTDEWDVVTKELQ